MSDYPTSVDTFPTLVDGEPAYAAYFNDAYAAVLAIQNTLGVNPQGGYSDVAAALAVANTTPGPTGPTGPGGATGATGPSGADASGVHNYLLMGC